MADMSARKTHYNQDPQAIQSLLANHALKSLINKVEVIEKMNAELKLLLPTVLHHHCQIINYRQPHLVIQASTSTVIGRLRFYETEILAALKHPDLCKVHWCLPPRIRL